MKNLTIASSLVTLSLGALLSACGAAETGAVTDEPGLESSDPSVAAGTLGESGEALTACDDPQYDHWRYISALAVAAGNELGRWNIADFTQSNGVQLSASGLARCTSGCKNVQAILGLQNNGAGVIPRLDPNLLKNYLVSFYNDQMNWQGSNGNGFNEHVLVPASVTSANCGYRYWYRDTLVKKTGTTPIVSVASNKCLDISGTADQTSVIQKTCNSGSQQKFVVEPILKGGYRLKNTVSGKCMLVQSTTPGTALKQQTCSGDGSPLFDIIDAGSGKFRLQSRLASTQCVEVPSTTDGAGLRIGNCNASSTAQQFTATLTTQTFDNPYQSEMSNALRFVGGGGQNPYIQFQYNAQQVSLDPLGTMVDGGATGQTGSCIDASSAFDSTRAIAGKCCTYSGKYGTFVAAAWNANLFYCK